VVTKTFSSNVTDPVADLLTRIRNANLAYKDELVAPVSKLSEALLRILQEEGYIEPTCPDR
jgi:small subunit ribosomal protein S8